MASLLCLDDMVWLFGSELQVKVDKMWEEIPKDKKDGEVDRLECWEFILKDEELMKIMGGGNVAKGRGWVFQTMLCLFSFKLYISQK